MHYLDYIYDYKCTIIKVDRKKKEKRSKLKKGKLMIDNECLCLLGTWELEKILGELYLDLKVFEKLNETLINTSVRILDLKVFEKLNETLINTSVRI